MEVLGGETADERLPPPGLVEGLGAAHAAGRTGSNLEHSRRDYAIQESAIRTQGRFILRSGYYRASA